MHASAADTCYTIGKQSTAVLRLLLDARVKIETCKTYLTTSVAQFTN
jgi:hypothetical protein